MKIPTQKPWGPVRVKVPLLARAGLYLMNANELRYCTRTLNGHDPWGETALLELPRSLDKGNYSATHPTGAH